MKNYNETYIKEVVKSGRFNISTLFSANGLLSLIVIGSVLYHQTGVLPSIYLFFCKVQVILSFALTFRHAIGMSFWAKANLCKALLYCKIISVALVTLFLLIDHCMPLCTKLVYYGWSIYFAIFVVLAYKKYKRLHTEWRKKQ